MLTGPNPFSPPKAAAAEVADIRRPIGVWIVSTLCVLQFVFIVWAVSKIWAPLIVAIDRGERSLTSVIAGLLFPGLLMVCGVFLFFMKRAATYLFGVYTIWEVAKMVVPPFHRSGILDLIWTALCFAYCVQLARTGRLR